MKKLIIICSLFFMILLTLNSKFNKNYLDKYQKSPIVAVELEEFYKTTFTKSYKSRSSEPPLETLQCPIPKNDRVKNYTGIQCVYSSIEMLGRWCGEEKLINPPITSRPNCKGYSSPNKAANILKDIGVKFEQTYGNKQKGIDLIKKAMKEGRGALWGVPGHAMVLIHYDESQNLVCWVDNSDYKLRVQKTTIKKFEERWNSWVLVIYPSSDDFLNKRLNQYIELPIINQDKNEKINFYIPFPRI